MDETDKQITMDELKTAIKLTKTKQNKIKTSLKWNEKQL